MKTYTFIIGSADDFDDIDDLIDYFEPGGGKDNRQIGNASAHEFEAPEECDEEVVTMIGRGIAFSNDWCMDNTFSFLASST